MDRRVKEVLAGLFVGGRSSRMGGRPKGLMRSADGTTIAERSLRFLRSLQVPVVLVGAAKAYASLGVPAIPDDPEGIGPLGGLIALLRNAPERALALACDMPFISRSLLERLLEDRGAPVLAPWHDGLWEPLFAIYRPARVLGVAQARAAAGIHSLQGLLDQVAAVRLKLSPTELAELRDWDSPDDLH
jgi:molybdopterin-guanine dinucleotide biosynthesis protein A